MTFFSQLGPSSIRASIENFLDASLEGIELPAGNPEGKVCMLDHQRLENLVIERPPFFLVERAVSIGLDYLLGIATISPERCEGHFPGMPVVPLIRMCEATAQTGVILVALNAGKDLVPIAIGSGESKTLVHDFTRPPVKLLIEAKLTKQKLGVRYVNGKIYAGGKGIAMLSDIKYMTIPIEKLHS